MNFNLMSNELASILIPILFIVIFLFIFVNYLKKRSMVWSGQVIDKMTTTTVDRDDRRDMNAGGANITFGGPSRVTTTFYVIVKTDEGKELKWKVNEGLYTTIKVGDKLKKEAGTMIPLILQ